MDEPEIPDPFCDPDKPITITFDEVTSAAYRIKSGIRNTECMKSEHLTDLTGMEIYIKKEFLQATGSFKERGARYAMMMLPKELKSKGIVAASAVVMPETAPIMKVQKCRNYRGNVIVEGKNLSESKKYALAYARDHGMMYLNGYDHPMILAGQGTIGLEVWEQIPGLQAVLVPVGGGGLVAGITVAIKALDRDIKIIGVEPERAACLTAALKAGTPVEVKVESTLADGLAVAKIGVNSFQSIRNILDKCVTVKEQYVALAILRFIEYEKSVVEGAGASGLAAILQGLLPELKGKKVCLILSGGNIDTTVLGRVLDRGLAADGRLVKAKLTVADRVGGVEDLCSIIGSLGVHIKDLTHERAWVTEDVFKVEVKVICECRDRDHSLQLREALVQKYGYVWFNGVHYPPTPEMGRATSVFAPIRHEPFEQVPSEIGKTSVQQNVIDLEPQQVGSFQPGATQTVKIAGGSLHSSQQTGGSFHPSQQGGGSFHPSQQGGGSFHPSQQGGGSFHPSQQGGVSFHPSQQGGGSFHPSQQGGGSFHPSQQGGGSFHPSQQGGGSLHPSQQGGGSLHPSQQGGGSFHPSQQGAGSLQSSQGGGFRHPSQQPPCPCSPPQQGAGSLHPSQQGGSFHPSQQGAGSLHPSQQGGSLHPSQQGAGSLHPSQQGGSFHPSQQMGGSFHPSQQGEQVPVGSLHASQQTAGTLPMSLSQKAAGPIGSSHPSQQVDVALSKPFSNCSCKRRGAPGDYNSNV
ncbi:hypothetical protein HHI36_013918 [Cryptolaemus montrouzieri]|uniref:L-serine deaminase n=1 Tax=Cryptolaemus montrouzieri TaxID=559131 RepID=A0ABD2N1U6_9CUCU